MSYKDPAKKRAFDRAWYAKRKGNKPGHAWRPGGPGRPPKGARAMMPACSLPGGKMRESHVYDEDGLCDCGVLIAGQAVAAIVADLEGRRDALDRAIAALRELQGSPA